MAVAFSGWLGGTPPVAAQDLVGFDRSDFGKVVLSRTQSAGVELELAVGSYNNESITNYSEDSVFARFGHSVERLDILTDTGIFPCTAFIVSKTHILTNYHCVPGIVDNPATKATRIDAVQFVAGYTRQGVEEGTSKYIVSPTPVEAHEDLDYALLEVIGNPSADYGMLELSDTQAHDGDPYWVIGHPMGEAQRISREKCRANRPALSDDRLLHTCDTLPGNSGSPVIDASLQKVVGLHHAGSTKDSVNFAIPMRLILERSEVLVAAPSPDTVVPGAGGEPDPTDPAPVEPGPGKKPGTGEAPPPDTPETDTAAVCDALYAEAKTFAACFAYRAYATQCPAHPYLPFAEGYLLDNCTDAPPVDPPETPLVDTTPPPETPVTALRPWCNAGALNPAETAICSDPYLAGLDTEMASAYDARPPGFGTAGQSDWLRTRRDGCGGDKACLGTEMTQRIAYLRQLKPKPETAPETPGNYRLPSHRCYAIVASRHTLAEARSFIAAQLTSFASPRVWRSNNGNYAVTVGEMDKSAADWTIAQYKQAGRVPPDSYCTSGRTFVAEVAWREGGGGHAPPPQQHPSVMYVDNNNEGGLNLRAGPGTGYSEIGEMEPGTRLDILSQRGGWSKLRLPDGRTGWAATRYLVPTKPYVRSCTAQVINLHPVSFYSPSNDQSFLSVRKKPSSRTGTKIAEVYQGDRLKVVAQRGGWARVKCISGQCRQPYYGHGAFIGWVSRKYLSIRCD